MMYQCSKESFKIKIVDLYLQAAGNKATGKQIFKLLEDISNGCQNADPGK